MTNQLNSIAKLAEALSKAQAIMSGAKKDKQNPFYRSNYADLGSVFEAIRQPFAANGLSISQTMDVLENGRTILKTLLLHSSGEFLESKMILPDLSDPQKVGASITYYRRFSLMSIAGIPAEDDDGNSVAEAVKLQEHKKNLEVKAEKVAKARSQKKKVSEESSNFIEEELKKYPTYQATIFEYLDKKNESIPNLTQEEANRIISKIDILEREKLEFQSEEALNE